MEREDKYPSDREIMAYLIGFGFALSILLIHLILNLWGSPRFDSYSFALTAVDGFSQMASGGRPGDPPLSPAFNLTLYVGNSHWLAGNCFIHGRVAVSYDGVVMGEGRVAAGWCAGARSTAEVNTVARARDGVRLPDGLRRRMEAELRWGAAELDVEAELSRDGARGPVLLRCKAVGPELPPQPSSPCRAFTDFQV
ncbi:hypothetical protein ACP70R_009962 [Stipagrostis hirtigluma subsp. patula]